MPLTLTPQNIGRVLDSLDRFDAAETAVLVQQLQEMETTSYAVKYGEYKALTLIPLKQNVNPGAQSVAYRMWDQYGMAKIIANYADDLPRVGVLSTKHSQDIESVGTSYEYSLQDLRAAAMAGEPLDDLNVRAARRATESAMDYIAAFGYAQGRMPGFLNHPNIPLVSPVTGDWATATNAEIEEDLRALADSIPEATGDVEQADTIILAPSLFRKIARPYGTESVTSILKVFLDTHPTIKNVEQWSRLDTADAAGTGPRAVAYRRAPDVLDLVIPILFETLPPEARNLSFVVNCHGRIGGVRIRYPLAIAFMDGL